MSGFDHTPEEAAAYREARIAAFGAIRRAAEIARRHHLKHTAYEDEHGASWASPGKCEAAAIRRAIRAAIGSAKR